MIGKTNVIVAFLVGCCVMALLFAIMPTKSVNDPNYSPWTDLNDDGVIDSTDLGMMGTAWGSFGDPITKAGLLFDSGWVNISDKCGKAFTIAHNLGSSDLAMEVTGKQYVDSGAHQMYYGLVREPGWRKLYGDKTSGYGDEFSNCIIHTKDGGYAIVGSRLQSTPTTNYDILLVKTDSTGDVEWAHCYGAPYNDSGNSVIEASDGGYVIAGSIDDSSGNHLLCLTKTDMMGNMLWSKTGFNDFWKIGAWNDVVEVSDGYVTAGFGYALPTRSAFVAKSNKTTGQFFEGQVISGSPDAMFSSVVATDTEDLVCAGTYEYYLVPHAAWWAKFDPTLASSEWKLYNATSTQDVIDDIVPTRDGGYILAGSAYNCSNLQGGWLIRVNATGDVQWDRKYSGSYECHFNSVVATVDGCVVFGIYWSATTSGAWTAKIDYYGSLVWSKVDDQTVIWNKVAGTLTDDGGYEGYVFTAHALTADYRCFVVRKVDLELGLEWSYTNAVYVWVYRGSTDSVWNYVRVRIWQVKPTP